MNKVHYLPFYYENMLHELPGKLHYWKRLSDLNVCSICHKQSQRAYLPVDKFVLETEEASEFYETSKRHLYSNFSAPVQCSHEMCSTAAHLTCAFLSQQWVICPSGARLKAPPKCTTHGLAGGGGGGVPVSDRPQLWCKYHWLVPISNRVTSRFGSSSGCNEKQRNRSVVVHSNSSNSSSLSPSSKRSLLSQDSGCRLSESSFNATSPYSTTSLDCCSDSSSDFNLEPYSRVRAKVPNFKKRLRGTYLGRSKIVEFYKVLFDDGSCSDNLLAEDFFGYNWSERGNPHLNERVDILWADGQLYPGKFTGVIATPFYEIEIDQINATKWVELKDLVLDSPQNVDS